MTETPYPRQEDQLDFPPARANVLETHSDLTFKRVSWDVLQSGDCFCRDVDLTLWSDGLADFSARTSTTDAGDVWLFKAIALLGPNDSELFRIGQFDGPVMTLSAFDYFVFRTRQKNPLIYPQQIFPLIESVVIYSHC